ncbi:sensor histidine kinase [Hankyongella ginsenosidimutans]|uniref:sensor histidine kinase n=1 Tax=Hankyongella ginsenosidimutans TaxID=1763828 RepID=UPI001CA347CC|nr:ATP-binding protein [Hankyongella ginsenosidimutans]
MRADRTQLEQVLVNLAVNARDAMAPDGGTLTITTGLVRAADVRTLGRDIMPPADYVSIAVSDTGCGIPPENLGKIFDPFFTTKEVGKGTGLGLSTVYGIIKQTGGFIFADSVIGQGTTFTVYLPVHSGEDALVKAPVVETSAPCRSRRRICGGGAAAAGRGRGQCARHPAPRARAQGL